MLKLNNIFLFPIQLIIILKLHYVLKQFYHRVMSEEVMAYLNSELDTTASTLHTSTLHSLFPAWVSVESYTEKYQMSVTVHCQ